MRRVALLFGVGVLAATSVALLAQAPTQSSRPAPAAAPQTGNPQLEQLIDRYVSELGGRRRPVQMMGDGNASLFTRPLEFSRTLLKELQAIDTKTLSFDQSIDYRYLEALLKSNIIDGEKVKRWQQDPRYYLPAGLIQPRGGINVDQSRPVESAARLLQITSTIPARLENGKKNLTQYVSLWMEPTKEQLDATIGIFEEDVPRLAERVPSQRDALLAEGRKSLVALRDFKQFLENELPKRPAGDWKIGREVLNARLRDVYLIDDLDADAMYRWGRRGYAEQLKILERLAARHGTRSWQQIELDNQADHSSAESVVYDYLMITRRARDWLVEKDLVTLPGGKDDPLTTSMLTRLVYSKLGLDPRWGSERREEYLRGRNINLAWAVMTHEAYPGHALTELYAQRNPRKLRATHSYADQSWCYFVEFFLAPEFGFYPPDRAKDVMVEMERNKLWRYARVIYEIGMHTGQVSFDEAVQLMRDGVVFSHRDSVIEVEATTQGSVRGDAVATYGYIQFLQLRDDYFARMGAMGRDGSIKDFNDRVLKIGMLPLKLLREALFYQIDQERQRTNSNP